MTTAYRRYVLQGDVEADGQAFLFKASYCILDLNGYTVTYGKTKKGSGVAPGGWNYHHLAVVNGSIIQSTQSIGAVVSATISAGGTGYTVGDTLTISSSGVEVPATFEVTGVSGGVVTSIALLTPGKGHIQTYYQRPVVYDTTGGTGTGAKLTVTSTVTEGDEYGVGPGPISKYSGQTNAIYSASYWFVGQVYAKWSGRDLGGIVLSGSYGIITQSTAEDLYGFGTLKNRHQGINAIALNNDPKDGSFGVVKNSTVIGARHRGIHGTYDCEIFGNYVTLSSIATNAVALDPGFGGQRSKIHDNTVIGRGEHPIGTFAGSGSNDLEFYQNIFDLQVTALGEEYGSSYYSDPLATYTSNSATGIRLTWSSYKTVAHDNYIVIRSDSYYQGTFSPTGETAYIRSGSKGLFIGLNPIDSTSEASFYNNTISVSGGGTNYGITCSYNFSDKMYVYNNTVESDHYNVVVGDEYGACNSFPLFWGNTLVKKADREDYKTIAGVYSDGDRRNQARFVNTIYQDGASESSLFMMPGNSGIVDIYFGTESNDLFSYHKRISDLNNTSATLVTETFNPPTTLSYANPVGVQHITCYQDADGDKYGAGISESVPACSAGYYQSTWFIALVGDCNDNNPNINPGAVDYCEDGIDQDCTGADLACPTPTPSAKTLYRGATGPIIR